MFVGSITAQKQRIARPWKAELADEMSFDNECVRISLSCELTRIRRRRRRRSRCIPGSCDVKSCVREKNSSVLSRSENWTPCESEWRISFIADLHLGRLRGTSRNARHLKTTVDVKTSLRSIRRELEASDLLMMCWLNSNRHSQIKLVTKNSDDCYYVIFKYEYAFNYDDKMEWYL